MPFHYNRPCETYSKENKGLEIYRDELPINPRDKEYDEGNLSNMCCWSRDINGDKHNFDNPAEFREYVDEYSEVFECVFNLYYTHENIFVSKYYDNLWDYGQIGYITVTKETVKRLGCVLPEDFFERMNKLHEWVTSEMNVYNDYLNGDVYGFELYSEEECPCCKQTIRKDLDSCWGFYGSDHKKSGLFEQAGWEV